MSRYAHIISSFRADYGGKGPLLDEAADAIEEAEERAEKYRNTLAEYLESHSKQAELIVRLEAELAAERETVAAYITSSAKCEAKLMAANEALLAAEMMLSELGINASDKCQMAYDHLHRYRTSDE